jgi:pSer/pThr/pTyr-binding forkhead associated (FHA) protein
MRQSRKKGDPELESETLAASRPRRRRIVPKAERRAVLVVVSGDQFGTAHVLRRQTTVIGRLRKCDVSLDDQLVSRLQCLIQAEENGTFFIEDMASENTTYLNGKRLRRRSRIGDGAAIVVGSTVLRFLVRLQADTDGGSSF